VKKGEGLRLVVCERGMVLTPPHAKRAARFSSCDFAPPHP
jgi:hypothetical protein